MNLVLYFLTTRIFRTAALLFGLSLLAGCPSTQPINSVYEGLVKTTTEVESRRQVESRLRVVQGSVLQSSPGNIDRATEAFVAAIGRTPAAYKALAYESIYVVRDQPGIVESIWGHYERAEVEDYETRLMYLAVLGELQQTEGIVHLRRVCARSPKPSVESQRPDEGGLGTRRRKPVDDHRHALGHAQWENILCAKAIHGMGFVANADGDMHDDAKAELVAIATEHPDRGIQIEAINTYMWNHADAGAAVNSLRKLLPELMHPFIERARFHKGALQSTFDEQLRQWEERWGQ